MSQDLQQLVIFVFTVIAALQLYKTCFCDKQKEYMEVPTPKTVTFEEEQELEEPVLEKPTQPMSQVVGSSCCESSPLELSSYEDAKIDLGTGCAGNDVQFVSSHLLPKDDPKLDDSFSEFAPKATDLQGMNFLDSDRFTAASQTTRNANLQLRSEPTNPRKMICPWMQSTIEPDDMRKPLEIGSN